MGCAPPLFTMALTLPSALPSMMAFPSMALPTTLPMTLPMTLPRRGPFTWSAAVPCAIAEQKVPLAAAFAEGFERRAHARGEAGRRHPAESLA